MENEIQTVLAVMAQDSRYHDLRIVAQYLGWTHEKVRKVLGLNVKPVN